MTEIAYRWPMEVYRSRDGRWSVERHLDQYLIYDLDHSPHDEVWSCRTLDQLHRWLADQGMTVSEFEETAPGAGSGEAWEL